MAKILEEKFFDVRVVNRYLKKNSISQKDYESHLSSLPNDEKNFELVMIEEDDLGVGDDLTADEMESLPEITEDDINNFDFMENEKKK